MVNVHILCEEYPTDNILNLILGNMKYKNEVLFKNFECINFINPTIFKYDNIYIHLVKRFISKGQPFPDYLVYVNDNLQPLSTDIPYSVYEVTKNTCKDSGNMCYQRLEKFVYLNYIFGKSAENIEKYIVYDTKRESDNKNKTLNISNRMCATLDINSILLYDNKKTIFNEDKYETLDELCSHINSTKEKKGTQNNRCYYKNGSIIISCNLIHSKKSENSPLHDPNTGFMCGLVATINKIQPDINIELVNHNITEKRINSKAKLWSCLYEWKDNITIEDYEKKWDLEKHEEYFTYGNLGEKISSILFQYYIEKYNLGTIIFHNHAGCERSFLEYNDITIEALKNKLPDLVVKKGNKIYCIEAEQNKSENIINGIKQLEEFDDFILDMKKKLKLNEDIIYERILITSGGIKHSKNINVKFSVLDNGNIFNNCELF